MTYEDLLKEAYEKVKPVEVHVGRFEIIKVKGMVEGKTTIITNFGQITSHLRRKPEHLEKFLEKELAAKGKIDGDRLILIKKIPSVKLNEKISLYAEKYVLCKECGKPDTEIVKENEFYFIHCLACGSKHSISKI